MESCGEGEGEEEEEEEEDGEKDGDDISNSSKRQRKDSGGRGGGGGSGIGSGGSRCNSSSSDINKDYSNSIPMDLWTVYVDSDADVGRDRTASSCDSRAHSTPPPQLLPDDSASVAAAASTTATALLSNMVTTSIAERPSSGATKDTYAYEDWEEIKEMLALASELCDDRAFCLTIDL